jgi:hypothetical protein
MKFYFDISIDGYETKEEMEKQLLKMDFHDLFTEYVSVKLLGVGEHYSEGELSKEKNYSYSTGYDDGYTIGLREGKEQY